MHSLLPFHAFISDVFSPILWHCLCSGRSLRWRIHIEGSCLDGQRAVCGFSAPLPFQKGPIETQWLTAACWRTHPDPSKHRSNTHIDFERNTVSVAWLFELWYVPFISLLLHFTHWFAFFAFVSCRCLSPGGVWSAGGWAAGYSRPAARITHNHSVHPPSLISGCLCLGARGRLRPQPSAAAHGHAGAVTEFPGFRFILHFKFGFIHAFICVYLWWIPRQFYRFMQYQNNHQATITWFHMMSSTHGGLTHFLDFPG